MLQSGTDLLPAIRSGSGTPLKVVVVSPDEAKPPSLSSFHPRVVTRDLTSVRSSDDVVVLYGDQSARDVERLRKMLGQAMPAVLVAARSFDADDVIRAFDNGATSYLLIDDGAPYCLADATRRTAARESCLSPPIATVLLQRMYQPTGQTVDRFEARATQRPRADAAGTATSHGLTAREKQIMDLLAVGNTSAEIGAHLGLTEKTVRNNLSNIYDKLQVRRQSEAILLWLGQERKQERQESQPAAPRPRRRPVQWNQNPRRPLAGRGAKHQVGVLAKT